jgi:hypothetical protein
VIPTNAKQGPIPSYVMLVNSMVLGPRLRGTEKRARFPRRAHE